MLKSFTVTFVSLLAAVMIGVGLAQWQLPKQAEQISQEAGAVPVDEAEEYEYLLKNHKGRLAVFERGATDPDMIFNVYIKSLPDFDQSQLQSGVTAKNYSELVALIEDYTS